MGQLEQMIAYQNAHGKLQEMSDDRAYEMQARKPNMIRKQMLLNTVPAKLEGLKGGAMPGLKRVVGGARKMKKAEEASRQYMNYMRGGAEMSDSEEECEEMEEEKPEKPEMKGGFLGALASLAIPMIGKLFGAGKMSKEAHDEMMGLFRKKGGASPAGEQAKIPAVDVYARGIATKRLPPGGIRAKAEQGADYAPQWFRDSGDIAGGAMKMPKAKAMAMPAEAPAPAPARAKRMLSDRQKARNAMVRKLMSEHGMKLGEASRYIKENNLI